MASGRCLCADQEDNKADNCQGKAEVAEPESILGRGFLARSTLAMVHPEVGHDATELLAYDGADNGT